MVVALHVKIVLWSVTLGTIRKSSWRNLFSDMTLNQQKLDDAKDLKWIFDGRSRVARVVRQKAATAATGESLHQLWSGMDLFTCNASARQVMLKCVVI